MFILFFFFNDTATTEIYTLSLHDALPIYRGPGRVPEPALHSGLRHGMDRDLRARAEIPALRHAVLLFEPRSEEHTSELQSHLNLVCRLLLEKKKYIPI